VLANGIPLKAPDISGWASSKSAPVEPQVPFKAVVLGGVQFQVVIRVKKVTRVIAKIPISIMYNPALRLGKVEVTGASTCDITLEGKESVLERITPATIRAFAFVDQEPTLEGRIITPPIEVRIQIPEEQRSLVSVVRVEPQTASLRLFVPK
jgi:hypothetical protein